MAVGLASHGPLGLLLHGPRKPVATATQSRGAKLLQPPFASDASTCHFKVCVIILPIDPVMIFQSLIRCLRTRLRLESDDKPCASSDGLEAWHTDNYAPGSLDVCSVCCTAWSSRQGRGHVHSAYLARPLLMSNVVAEWHCHCASHLEKGRHTTSRKELEGHVA